MTALTNLVSSTIGKKVLMGVTGLVMVAWLFVHMSGNLLVFAGQQHFNEYAHFIQSGFGVEPALLWVMRLVMLGAIGGHIWAAAGLVQRNRAARSTDYQGGRKNRATTYFAQFMLGGGVVVLLYLIFHLLHLTVGVWSDDVIQQASFDRTDAYKNLVVGLSNKAVGAVYIIANLALGAHLAHGVGSAFQTLGANDQRWNPVKRGLGMWLPLLIAGGNVVIALTCMFATGTLIEAPDPNWTPTWTTH